MKFDFCQVLNLENDNICDIMSNYKDWVRDESIIL